MLPDWRPALTPTSLQPKPSVMSVRYRGVTHRIQYVPGPDGLEAFLATLQSIGIKVASASQVTFLCRSPDTGEEMALRGLKAFDAAAYCASITAAKRLQRGGSGGSRRGGSAGRSGANSGAVSPPLPGEDASVHAQHPDSPTAAAAAAAAGAERCELPPPRGASPAPEAAAPEAAAPQRPRFVAHVHAEALAGGEISRVEAAAAAVAAAAAAAEAAEAAAPAAPAHAHAQALPLRRPPRRLRSRRAVAAAAAGAGAAAGARGAFARAAAALAALFARRRAA